jgi:hypothetical protein
VIVAVLSTLQTVDVRISPDGATGSSGVDSGQSKTVAVDTVLHSVAVRTAGAAELQDDDDDSQSCAASVNSSGFSTGA